MTLEEYMILNAAYSFFVAVYATIWSVFVGIGLSRGFSCELGGMPIWFGVASPFIGVAIGAALGWMMTYGEYNNE